jgi:hypothetical protein
MERVLEEREAEEEFGEDVLRRAAGLLSARRQIIHKWDLSGLAAGDLVSACPLNVLHTIACVAARIRTSGRQARLSSLE